jgi:DNA-directed RNA polymerase specialized sigma24 family protein
VGASIQLSAFAVAPTILCIMTHEAFGKAYRNGFMRTVRLLLSRGSSMDNAEDVAQAAWLQGWQKLSQLRDEGMIVNWVNTIAINYHRRGIKREARYEVLTDVYGNGGIDMLPIETSRILKFCRPGDRILFEHQLGGLTTEEIAKQQRATTTAIRIRLLRARRSVRARMEDHAFKLRRSFERQEQTAAAS